MNNELSPEQRGIPLPGEPLKLWDVRIGSLVFTVNASTREAAKELACEQIGAKVEGIQVPDFFAEPHEQELEPVHVDNPTM